LLIKSPEGRNIDLLTITSQEGKIKNSYETYVDEIAAPLDAETPRA